MKQIFKTGRCLRLVVLCLAVLWACPVKAELQIDVTGGNVDPVPVAIPDFFGQTEQEIQTGKNIAAVISHDLVRSGLFRTLAKDAFIQTFTSMNVQPRFVDWQAINAQALVQGRVSAQDDGKLRVEFRLWDVFASSQLKAQALMTKPENWRRISHIIADAVYKRMTGEDGYFDTRIVYIAETGPLTKRIKRLAIMDQDGANHRFLTDGQALVLTPRFSPTAQKITYLSYYRDVPRVYLFDVETGKRELLGNFPDITFAPRFSPDGKKVIMSMSEHGDSDIYSIELANRRVKRLTRHPAIDTSPSYSPDMKKITFNSDRGGAQQLYVMDADGSDVKRISFGKGRYATPVWSPRGDYIAFTKMSKGKFYIGVMHPDGSGERLLTEGYLVEAPTWAPNGRVLMFFRQKPSTSKSEGWVRLYSIDLTGRNEMEIVTPVEASDPAWSPLLP